MLRRIVSLLVVGAGTWIVAGCSDSKNAAPPPPVSGVAPVAVAHGYRAAETFNVGENVYVRSIATDPQTNSLWVGTSVGVIEVDLATRDMRSNYTRDNGMANEYVFSIFIDSRGEKWFGTNGGGVSRYDGAKWKTYFPMHGLADYWVYSFTEQRAGTMWVGTWAGLNALDIKTGTFKTYLKELVNEWVYGLAVDSKDRVWVGTEGGINMFDGQNWKTWTHAEGLGAPNTDNLPVSSNTGLGTRSRHDLSILMQGKATYNPNYVFNLLMTPEDVLWAGTWGGGVARFDGNTWTNFTTKDGLGGDVVYSVAREPNGVMWFGTNGGLTRYDGKTWTTLHKQDGLLDENVYCIAALANGDIWAGTRGGVTLLTRATAGQ